jgi:hypothetical protein
MVAFEVGERFYEIGTPSGYRETDAFLRASAEWERLSRGLCLPPAPKASRQAEH